MNEPRVVIDYVCTKNHRLAAVIATPHGYDLKPVQVPVADVGNRPGHRRTTLGVEDAFPVLHGGLWATELACACGRSFLLTQSDVERDIATGTRRVTLHAMR